MKKLLLTYCSISILCTLHAQDMLYGTLCDEKSIPVAYAVVYDEAQNRSVATNEQGVFTLESSDVPPRVVVSAMGYKSDTIQIVDNYSIYTLTRNEYLLKGIVVGGHQHIESKSTVAAHTTSEQEIERISPRSINEALENKSGFTSSPGYQSAITLRGLSGKRLVVLRNGTRRFSSYPAGFMSHIINVYDLERIEVEKGASSVIYGEGAIAGVINLIDRSPFEQSGFSAKITTGYGSVNSERNILASSAWSSDKFAARISFRYRDADNYTYPDGSVAENSFYQDRDLSIGAGYKISDSQSLLFTADFHDGGPWGKPVGFNGSNYMRVQTDDEISNNYALKYTISSSGLLSRSELNLFYSDEKRELIKSYYAAANYMLSYVETTHYSDHYYGFNIKSLLKFSKRYSATVGAESYLFNISTPVDAVDYIYEVQFNKRVSYNAHSLTSGLFAESKFEVNNDLQAILGLRYNYAIIDEGDAYSDIREPGREQKQAFSGNFALRYKMGYNNLLKFNVARSFRMPETTELYSDNFSSNGIVYANPDLLPEYCNSVDLSYRFKSRIFEVEISPFLWLMSDMISKEELGGTVGTNYIYVNIGKTRIFGGEVNSSLTGRGVLLEGDKITLQAGVAYLNGTDVTDASSYLGDGTPLNYVPPLNLKSNLHYALTLNNGVDIYLQLRATYYSEQSRLGDDPYATPAYLLLGCNAGVELSRCSLSPKLNIAVNNLLNREYYPYLSYIPAEGRDVRIFLTLNF